MLTWRKDSKRLHVSVLASRYHGVVPELMAYLVTITCVSQDFSGLAWVRYDAAFRRQAAITGNRKWSQINPSLYSICFTRCAQALKCCELCLSSTHTTNQCALAADPDPELPARLKAVESAVVSLATQHQNAHKVYRPMLTKMCRLYNDNRCRFPKCRYHLACLKCNGDHPASSCIDNHIRVRLAVYPSKPLVHILYAACTESGSHYSSGYDYKSGTICLSQSKFSNQQIKLSSIAGKILHSLKFHQVNGGILEDIADLLEPYTDATTYLSLESYPTISALGASLH